MLPIVLVHGIARFDFLAHALREELGLPEDGLADRLHYFKNVRAHLAAHGFNRVFYADLDFASSSERRARQLADRIDAVLTETGAEQAHVVAHSMGGLDARRMIVDLGMAGKIASLTTLGTPHLGTILADHVIGHGGRALMLILKNAVRLDAGGFNDLTIAACETFNRRAEPAEAANAVVYQTYASFEEASRIFAPLLPSWLFIRDRSGRNDGLVPFASQQWKGELLGAGGERKTIVQKEFPLPADHLNQVGWWDARETVDPFSGGGVFKQKADYEEKIRDVYLAIARDAQALAEIR